MSAHKPTDEQQAIIAAAQTGGSMKIEAGAGSGKTSTLRLVAEALAPKRGLYLAYNKAIQVEASTSFPENVECRTAHSVAYRAVGRKYQRRLNAKRISASQYAAVLHLAPFSYRHDGEGFNLEPWRLAIIIKETIARFCNSASREVECRHIPRDLPVPEDQRPALCNHLTPYLTAAWEDIKRFDGQLTFTHDCYLKMWSLSNPTLDYDFILFDEAQDANPCIAVVVQNQRAQQIMVGDSAQAIYGWRGAIDAMKNFEADHHLFLSQSFRFGEAVAEQANRWLAQVGASLRIKGFDQVQSTVESLEKPNAILCRTNAGCIESAMKAQEDGHTVSIVGGVKEIESFTFAARDLQSGKDTTHPELGAFHSWTEVQEAVKNGEANDLGMMVRLIDNYSTGAILSVCYNSRNIKPEEADVIVSTAHKAKGLEWDAVKIHSDFKAPKEPEDGSRPKISITEAMLVYVAVTRSRRQLDNSALAWLDGFEAAISEEEAGA